MTNVTISWRLHAACIGADPEIFFPTVGKSVKPAKNICARCPVTEQCLTAAVTRRERFGVWGGQSEQDRKRKREPKPFVHGTNAGYRRHHTEGSEPCDACRDGHSEYMRALRRRKGVLKCRM